MSRTDWSKACDKELEEVLDYNVIHGNITYKDKEEITKSLKGQLWDLIDNGDIEELILEEVSREIASLYDKKSEEIEAGLI